MNVIRKIMNILRGKNSHSFVTINGQTYSGNNVSIVNGNVVIDGVKQEQLLIGPVTVTVHGSVDKVETGSGDVTVLDVVGSVETMSGDVSCTGDIGGYVTTMSGDVTAGGHIGGDVETMSGDIIQGRE
jgi:hypothetical protein